MQDEKRIRSWQMREWYLKKSNQLLSVVTSQPFSPFEIQLIIIQSRNICVCGRKIEREREREGL